MATLSLWAGFTKRRNSTKQPSGSADATKTVRLKEGTSLQQPTFVLDGQMHGYNYAQFAGMYYYIDDVVIAKNNITELNCSLDRLATYKAAIQASSAYVLYYTHNNTEIVDRRLSVKTTQVTQSANGSFASFGNGSVYVISVIGEDHVAQIEISLNDLKEIVNQSFLTTLENQITSVTLPANDSLIDFAQYILDLLATEAGALTYIGKVSECIRNCYVLPITTAGWGGILTNIKVGKSDTGKQGYELTDRIFHDSATVNIPWQASDWRRNSPYHEIYLYIPFIGLTSISPSDVIDEVAIHVDISLDKISGDIIAEVATASKVIAYYTANVAVNYPIGSAPVDVTKAVTAIGGGIAAAAAGMHPAALATVEALGITNALQPQPTCIGGNSGGAFLGLVGYTANKVYCFTVFHDTTVTPSSVSAIAGTPYNGVMSLSGVSGYVQTSGAAVDMAGLGNDKDIVNNYLNGGIYIE